MLIFAPNVECLSSVLQKSAKKSGAQKVFITFSNSSRYGKDNSVFKSAPGCLQPELPLLHENALQSSSTQAYITVIAHLQVSSHLDAQTRKTAS